MGPYAAGGTVLVFPGQRSPWVDTAAELLDSAPAFAEQMRICDAPTCMMTLMAFTMPHDAAWIMRMSQLVGLC